MRIDYKPFLCLVVSLLLASLACGTFGASPTATPVPLTEMAPPTDISLPPGVAAPPSSGQCTTLQDLNLRTGPGLAYRNPIGVVLEGSVIEPVGYVPDGLPGGSWILIEADGENQDGWITAGENFITCDIDLNSLPEVNVVPPPPPPLPRSVQTSDAEGNCGPNENYQCEVIITDESFLQFKIFQNDKELTENDNVIQVSISVRRGGKDDNGPEVYTNVEESSMYCIFGGNGPCNAWPEEDFVPVWEPGSPVSLGTHFIEIIATVNEDGDEVNVRWAAEFDVTLP